MPRPYIQFSIDQLEAEHQRAIQSGDGNILHLLIHEIGFRTTRRARKLGEAIAAKINGQSQSTQPPSSANHVQERRVPPPESRTRPVEPRPTPIRETNLRPTPEQEVAIELFKKGGSLKINAYAGTGKTSTLELLSHSTTRRGQYIAFNRSIVREAKERFPNNVDCSTSHSLALKSTPSAYKQDTRKVFGKMNAIQLAEILQLKKWQIDSRHILHPRSLGYLIQATIRRYSQSADLEINSTHVPRHGSLLAAPESTLKAVTDFAVNEAKIVWARMVNEHDSIPLGHDGYLKLWALSNPILNTDFILLDEAQDTNPVVLDVLKKQPAQMIYVGDKYQQIYEWRGAVNAMEEMKTDNSTYLTQSFRFGPIIAAAATKILNLLNEPRPLTGNPSGKSQIGSVPSPKTILARTNSSTISAVIEAIDNGKKPCLVGGNAELMQMLRGVTDLKEGRPSDVPDFFGFENWQQVIEFANSGEGDHLQAFVNLVNTRGEKMLMWALNRTVDESECDIVISTAHKAKGREWSTVRLMDDFLKSSPDKKKSDNQKLNGFDPAELRLFYVAFTRAKEMIEVSPTVLSLLR